jgi:hypothetical protein
LVEPARIPAVYGKLELLKSSLFLSESWLVVSPSPGPDGEYQPTAEADRSLRLSGKVSHATTQWFQECSSVQAMEPLNDMERPQALFESFTPVFPRVIGNVGPCVTRLCWLSQDASFHLRERQYRQQYSALYFTRLMQLKPVMEQRVRHEWPQVEGTVTWDRRPPSFLLPLGSPDCSPEPATWSGLKSCQ